MHLTSTYLIRLDLCAKTEEGLCLRNPVDLTDNPLAPVCVSSDSRSCRDAVVTQGGLPVSVCLPHVYLRNPDGNECLLESIPHES